jgi:NSS family neurotransmitter:Na+ symporter
MAEVQYWSSRKAFVLAVVGSAVGLGNLWRFPYIAYENGGGAFLIPYLIALLTAGVPLLILETGVGYRARAGAPLAFRRMLGKGYEVFGWLAVLTAFLIVTYYAVIIAWGVNYAFFSLNLAWGPDPGGFFYTSFLHLSPAPDILGSINWLIVMGAVVAWVWVYVSIVHGVSSVEKMIRITVTLPWLLIIIFVIRGVTLPGAWDGLAYYLTPDFSALLQPGVWIAAYGQIFYSLSLGMAIIIAYSRCLREKQDVVKNAIIIALANSFTSIFAGLAVFSTLGYLAYTKGVPVTEVVESGIELVFVTYPAAISALPVVPQLFGVLFFVMLVTLGIDSAFSLVESVSAAIEDYVPMPRWLLNAALCVGAFSIGLLFATSGGLYWLDIIDHYINNFLLLLIGFTEAVLIGYLYGPSVLRGFVNRFSDWQVGRWWDFSIRVVVPGFLGIALVLNVIDGIRNPYGGYPDFANAIGWACVIAIPFSAVFLTYALRNREVPEETEETC